MISLRDVSFKYDQLIQHRFHLKIDRLEIASGSKSFIFGPSGSGKTTFLEILGGVLVPQSGVVQILQTDFTKISQKSRDAFRASHIGFIFQNFNLIPYLSVEENISLPCFFSRDKKTPHAKIPDWIERLELKKLLDV